MNEGLRPIFYDRTGKRSLVVYICLALGVLGFVTLGITFMPPVLATEQPVTTNQGETIVNDITAYAANNNIAIIGEGPFVQVVAIKMQNGATVAINPFTQQSYDALSPADSLAVKDQPYALQRFGQQNKKRIALTYDDGPDITYTPRILDTLSRESVPATFFMVGTNVVQYEDIARRVVNEGHTLGNHTFSHIDFEIENHFRGLEEIIQTDRITRAVAGHTTKLFRTPYVGGSNQSLRNEIYSIATTQRLGYVEVDYTDDSNDWQFTDPSRTPTYPNFKGTADIVLLLHDGGGNRDKTIAYTKDVIQLAKQQGYTFTTIDKMAKSYINDTFVASTPSDNDLLAHAIASGIMVLPQKIILGLFVFSLVMIFLTTVINTIFAWLNLRKPQLPIRHSKFKPRVGVIVPAYNEGIVLEKTVQSLRASTYKNIDIVMIDDGSTDDTWSIMQRIVRRYKRGVHAIHQENTGKSGALNNAISQVDCDIVICLDADTIFDRTAIAHLVKHFVSPEVGAVAGVVKVGNIHNYITRWQALEYNIGIMLERNAQSFFNAITIVPGACGAWRRQAVLDAGGFSHRTLAEDCDLTYGIHRLGYRVVQENNALSYTEAPHTLRGLMKQRFRWTFGNFQALWVHRDIIFDAKYKMLSNFVMPMIIINILAPLLFWPLVIFITIQNLINGNYLVIILFFLGSLAIQATFAAISLKFAKERYRLLLALPIARFIFSPILTYIMYRSIVTAFTGKYVGWNKLIRSGTVTVPLAPAKIPTRSTQ